MLGLVPLFIAAVVTAIADPVMDVTLSIPGSSNNAEDISPTHASTSGQANVTLYIVGGVGIAGFVAAVALAVKFYRSRSSRRTLLQIINLSTDCPSQPDAGVVTTTGEESDDDCDAAVPQLPPRPRRGAGVALPSPDRRYRLTGSRMLDGGVVVGGAYSV